MLLYLNYFTMNIVLFALFLITSICISIIFIYFHWYSKSNIKSEINNNEDPQTNNINNRPLYFFNDTINIKAFDPSLLDIDKISFKNTDDIIYDIEYIPIRYIINSANSLYLIFGNVVGCNEILLNAILLKKVMKINT